MRLLQSDVPRLRAVAAAALSVVLEGRPAAAAAAARAGAVSVAARLLHGSESKAGAELLLVRRVRTATLGPRWLHRGKTGIGTATVTPPACHTAAHMPVLRGLAVCFELVLAMNCIYFQPPLMPDLRSKSAQGFTPATNAEQKS